MKLCFWQGIKFADFFHLLEFSWEDIFLISKILPIFSIYFRLNFARGPRESFEN